jgi:hypothetical protein
MVAAVDTRDYWRDVAQSPADQGYHWKPQRGDLRADRTGHGQAMMKLMPVR